MPMRPATSPKTAQAQCLLTVPDRDRLDEIAASRRLSRSEFLREIVLARIQAEGQWAMTSAAPMAGQYELPFEHVTGHEN